MLALVFIAVAILIAAAVAGRMIHERWFHRRRIAACPKCGEPVEGFAEADDADGNERQGDIVWCQSVSYSPFEECSFSIPRWCLDVPWLHFAGVGGTPCAGQTTWNAACSSRLRPFLVTKHLSIEALPSNTQEDMQRIWDDIEMDRRFPAATQTVVTPTPWCQVVRGRSRGASRLVVAVSDFAGEIPRLRSLEDEQYRRLLSKDGYLFFIDLNQLEQAQLNVFHDFLVNLRAVRELRHTAGRLPPIAVCIGKSDLLPLCMEVPENAARAVRCTQEIRASGPVDEATTLSAIRHRHELVLKHAVLLPCVRRLNGRLQDECGKDRFMFFPMASVGWEGNRDPETAATIVPYGVVDPLLWLLHVSGMKALSR